MTHDGAMEEPSANRRVLIVEDQDDLRHLLWVLVDLEPGFEVVAEAANGVEAITAAKEQQPDVIILDLWMPVLDGLRALPDLRAAAEDAAIVVYSAMPADTYAEVARDRGADIYVEKGGSIERLLVPLRALAAG